MNFSSAPQIVVLSGPSAGQVLPVDGTGVRLLGDQLVRLHDGRAVLYAPVGGTSRPAAILDHGSNIRAGEIEYRFEHSEFDPANVRTLFPGLQPIDPVSCEEDVQLKLIDFLRQRITRKVGIAVILNCRGPRMIGFGTYDPGPFIVNIDLIDDVQAGFLP